MSGLYTLIALASYAGMRFPVTSKLAGWIRYKNWLAERVQKEVWSVMIDATRGIYIYLYRELLGSIESESLCATPGTYKKTPIGYKSNTELVDAWKDCFNRQICRVIDFSIGNICYENSSEKPEWPTSMESENGSISSENMTILYGRLKESWPFVLTTLSRNFNLATPHHSSLSTPWVLEVQPTLGGDTRQVLLYTYQNCYNQNISASQGSKCQLVSQKAEKNAEPR